MRRALVALILALGLVATAGCGGSGGGGDDAASKAAQGTEPTETEAADKTLTAPAWAAPYLRKAGPEGAIVLASSDFAVGKNRLTFLLVREDSSLIRTPLADVYYKPSVNGPPQTAVAKLLSIGVSDSAAAKDEVKEIYVAELRLPRTGKQWVVVQPRGTKFQGFQILDVKQRPVAIGVGDAAPASRNPTTASEPARKITTARPPDTGLLRYSVAESLQANKPFVVAFATPSFCQSRTCGPTVEVVDAVRRRYESRGIRFIHIEIYEDNLPGNGVNRWVREWKLPTEPWVYVVDRTGVVRDRFEGAISILELERSIQRNLLR